MGGQPVWLASVSIRHRDRPALLVPTNEQSRSQRAVILDVLRQALEGVGDPEHERGFRMCSTTCIHRKLDSIEMAGLPSSWDDTPPDSLAGGPLEVLWEKGIRSPASTRPCSNPKRLPISAAQPKLYLPGDCGRCPSCLARVQMRDEAMAAWRRRKGIK